MKYKSKVINYLTTIVVYMLLWLLYFMDIINAFVYIGTLLSGLIILLVLGIFFEITNLKRQE
ncbi:hypothetical protein C1N55_03340 [Lysinibacillus sp. SGAir0095]|nr:hypothetical protein C1N55_03340 [Lysinibacillus sp. SGAir0095]